MMMNRTVKTLLLGILVVTGLQLWAQQKAKPKADDKGHGAAAPAKTPNTYLGKSEYKGGTIKKEEFERLLRQGLTCHDSLGNKYKVMGFDFTYVERELYEDSIGNLKMMTDAFYEYCAGDTVSGAIAASIYDRVKPGDTVFIERVKVARYLNKNMKAVDTVVSGAKGMKCVIVSK